MTKRLNLRGLDPTGATDGQVPTYDAATGQAVWADGTTSGGVAVLDDLTDVDTTTATPADGDVLTYDTATGLWGPAAPPAGGGGGAAGRVLLSEVAVAATTATITFSSSVIPSTGYKHLRLEVLGRSNASAVNDTIRVYFNGDTTAANYFTKQFYATTASGYNTFADSQPLWFTGGTATANRPGVAHLDIPHYRGTTWHKTGLGAFFSAGSPVIGQSDVTWANTAPITSITLNLAGGASFVAGTVAWLYGLT